MSKYEDMFLASSKAYDDQDYDKMMSFVADDYQFYGITDDGPKLRANGKDQATAALKMVLESDSYVKGEVDFLKGFGNLVIALEKDRFREDDQVVTRSTLGVYEYRGNKLVRAFSFPVKEE